MEMGLFGVSLSGSPICGTYNSSTATDIFSEVNEEQLCTRWYQMGMMFPFAHSMTKLNHRARSPVDWSLNTRRLVAGYIQQRYRLLSHFYTLFYQVNHTLEFI
jgi:alpha-glucosidase (family GH31 glycosyl hydrolase)